MSQVINQVQYDSVTSEQSGDHGSWALAKRDSIDLVKMDTKHGVILHDSPIAGVEQGNQTEGDQDQAKPMKIKKKKRTPIKSSLQDSQLMSQVKKMKKVTLKKSYKGRFNTIDQQERSRSGKCWTSRDMSKIVSDPAQSSQCRSRIWCLRCQAYFDDHVSHPGKANRSTVDSWDPACHHLQSKEQCQVIQKAGRRHSNEGNETNKKKSSTMLWPNFKGSVEEDWKEESNGVADPPQLEEICISKAWQCGNSSTQQEYMLRNNMSSPMVNTESTMLTAVIEAQENREVVTCNIPNAFIHTEATEKDSKLTKPYWRSEEFWLIFVCEISPSYAAFFQKEKQGRVHYLNIKKAIYRMVELALLLYKSWVLDSSSIPMIFVGQTNG
jgi:hypothetical protein